MYSSLSSFLSYPTHTHVNHLSLTSLPVFDCSLQTSELLTYVNPWSVNGATLNAQDVAASLFGVSLFPYLVLLFFLARPKVGTPPLANFGFQFLLAFVFATIPAGIYAKTAYHDILANVDWLHGSAESLLTITNLLIVFGFRKSRTSPQSNDDKPSAPRETILRDMALPISLAIIVLSSSFQSIFPHAEPANALSIPTWMVHVSSLQEWLIAMKYIWEHAATTGNPRWKGMTWGMLPSHTSGICACTYHFFYNNPDINWIVALQAFLTVFGNTTMAYAAYRIFAYADRNTDSTSDPANGVAVVTTLPESDGELAKNVLISSVLGSLLIKYGELFSDFPFDPQWYSVMSIILVSTAIHGSVYAYKSVQERLPVGSSSPL